MSKRVRLINLLTWIFVCGEDCYLPRDHSLSVFGTLSQNTEHFCDLVVGNVGTYPKGIPRIVSRKKFSLKLFYAF